MHDDGNQVAYVRLVHPETLRDERLERNDCGSFLEVEEQIGEIGIERWGKNLVIHELKAQADAFSRSHGSRQR